MYFIILYKLYTIQSWYQQNNKYAYLCIFSSQRTVIEHVPEHYWGLGPSSSVLGMKQSVHKRRWHGAESLQSLVGHVAWAGASFLLSSVSWHWDVGDCLLPQQDLVSTDWCTWVKTLYPLGCSLVSLQWYLLVGFQREPEVMSILPLASSRALWIMLFIDSSVLINDDLSDLKCSWDFPGGPMVKNLPASTGYVGSILGPGRSHCCETTTEPVFYRVCKPQLLKPACSRACAPQQEKPLPWEACTPQLESGSHSPQLEKGWAQQQRPSTAKHKYISKKSIKMPLSQFIQVTFV